SWLFVAPPSPRDKDHTVDLRDLDAAFIDPGLEPAQQLRIEHVAPWSEFISFVDARLKANPKTILYLDDAGQVGGFMGTLSNPPGLLPIENPYLLWATAIKTKW